MLRPWSPADAPGMKAAIDSSVADLAEWLPWARREPTPVAELTERCRRFQEDFLAGRDYFFGVFERDGTAIGGAGLHPRRRIRAFEIGYWLRSDRAGRGLVTEAAAALTRAALELHEIRRIEIRCDPANVRSAAIPRRLGYRHRTTIKARIEPGDHPLHTMLWTVVPSEWGPTHPAYRALRAEDAEGHRLIDDAV